LCSTKTCGQTKPGTRTEWIVTAILDLVVYATVPAKASTALASTTLLKTKVVSTNGCASITTASAVKAIGLMANPTGAQTTPILGLQSTRKARTTFERNSLLLKS
jgi:hypothetical protein